MGDDGLVVGFGFCFGAVLLTWLGVCLGGDGDDDLSHGR